MLFGFEDKTKKFEALIRDGHLGHAYLFFGDSHIGKATFANLFAYYLEHGEWKISSDPLLDAMRVKPRENGSIGIEDVREVRRFLWQSPLKSSRRLAIIDDAHALTPEAQGALLKIVEEPPRHAMLFFIAHDPEVLFPPLRSRLTKIYFPRLPQEMISKILSHEYGIPEKKAEKIAKESFGRLGRALDIAYDRSGSEKTLEGELEDLIIQLRNEDVVRNAKLLSKFLSRESLIKRYNLNESLQRKALAYEESHSL